MSLQGVSGETLIKISNVADSKNNIVFSNVTDMGFDTIVGTRARFNYSHIFVVPGVVSGMKFQILFPAGLLELVYQVQILQLSTRTIVAATATNVSVVVNVPAGVASAYVCTVQGIIRCGAVTGTVQPQFAQLVADGANPVTIANGQSVLDLNIF